MSPFWTFISFFPVLVGGCLLVWYAIRKHLALSADRRDQEERRRVMDDARNILNGTRRPTDADVAEFLVRLQEGKRLIDNVLDATVSDPIVEITLRDLRDALKTESTKLEQRGIR